MCKSNYSQNLNSIYSLSIIPTEPKLITNSKVVKVSESKKVHLIYLIFCIASKQAMKVLEDKRFYLIYLLVYVVSKQAVKVSRGRRVCLAYLVVCITELYCKILKRRKVFLIYLIFHSK